MRAAAVGAVLGLLAAWPPLGASAATARLQASARQPAYDEADPPGEPGAASPGDISGVPELEDVLRGVGMHELYEDDTVASASQVMEVVEYVAGDVKNVASSALKTAQGTAKSAAGEVGKSILTDTLAKAAANTGAYIGSSDTPESAQNLATHGFLRPTAKPHPTGTGLFCKGISCGSAQHHQVASGGAGAGAAADQLPDQEMCRGLACVGMPLSPSSARRWPR
ncbi:unnamed protein product [Prorocentrum cordatum]|uniref:Senescence domain-containing protein n=1 Tax=Prorocentrum cordatum TaxID=2364126 RepID=A0ABN9RBL1_9DINO|nr:unnamed protein product [Polarella glacialis]